MRDRYVPSEFEHHWRDRWLEADLFRTTWTEGRPKFYGLDFFPYPSGAGLSVGHCRNYIPTDVICRMKRMQGFNVLHPMGFDAFGLPAENAAIKEKRHPAGMIDDFAANYKRQMDLIGIGYDWSRSFKSSDADYYRWTQWIFKILFDRGLAYRKMAAVNWDPVDKTVLADEEVIGGRAERSGALVEKKFIPQWFFRITEYAQRLIDDLDDLDWPEGIKQQQRNWIGRSEGVQFRLLVEIPAEHRATAEAAHEDWAHLATTLTDLRNDAHRHCDRAAALLREAASPLATQANITLAELVTSGDPVAAQRAIRPALDALTELQDAVAASTLDSDLRRAALSAIEGAERALASINAIYSDIIAATQPDDDFTVKSGPLSFEAFTTRIDTLFGVTFCVLAPEHTLVDQIRSQVRPRIAHAIRTYQRDAKELSDTDRQAANREKTGVLSGAVAINPATGQPVPLFIADYVLMGYGTSAIMAVPGHDERDFEFAQEYGVPVVPVIAPDASGTLPELPYPAKEGVLINSGSYSGMSVAEAQSALADWIEQSELGSRKVNFKLRDWLISRQRYWGCPIPIVYDQDGEMETVPDDALPVELPVVEHYEPSGDGSSPLAHIEEFVNCTTRDGKLGRRETDTMGGFACSSWYFLRFCDPDNQDQAWSPESLQRWMPVDCYVGGAEHAVMHLLYARFWTKVLFDAGLVPVKEPFARLLNQGQVLAQSPYRQPREGERLDVGEDGILVSFAEAKTLPENELSWKWVRMSKSKGNVVTPDEAVDQYGADALRTFELFVAPFEQAVQWSNEGMQGSVRFLSRVMKWVTDVAPHSRSDWPFAITTDAEDDHTKAVRRATHRLIAKVTSDLDRFAFNTAIAAMMETLNTYSDLMKQADWSNPAHATVWSEAIESYILLLAPIAPHTADELWSGLGKEGFTLDASWPTAIEALTKADAITIAVQVNGKLRDTLEVPAETDGGELEALALASDKVKAHLDGKTVRKVVVVPGRLVNVVAN